MKRIFTILLCIPFICQAQFVTQGICTQSAGTFVLNGVSQSPYTGRVFCTVPFNLNSNFDLTFNTYLGSNFNNGFAFLFINGAVPTATYPALSISTDNIHNFGTGSIATDFVVEFDVRGSFCAAGQNTTYEPTTDLNHIAYWKNNSSCNFGNYYSPFSSFTQADFYSFYPTRIKWTKSTNTLETYYNGTLIKSNVIDLVGLLGTTVYWGFSSSCYCVPGGPQVSNVTLNGTFVLPIKLIDFNAEKSGKAVKLNWSTSMENNTSHFNIEKSNDGISYSFLQRVAATGFSNAVKTYSGIDPSPFYGTT